jgi:hypothetical protein
MSNYCAARLLADSLTTFYADTNNRHIKSQENLLIEAIKKCVFIQLFCRLTILIVEKLRR